MSVSRRSGLCVREGRRGFDLMKVRVLGSAAGGGYPQWNCNCPMCDGLRRGRIQSRPRTQSSIAVSSDEVSWALFNASPDILEQLRSFPQMQPARALRDTGIAAIILIDGQIDHTAGLAMLRESRVPLPIWSTACVREDLTHGNPLFTLLGHYCGIDWHEIPASASGAAFDVEPLAGLAFRALPLVSNAPPYSPHRDRPQPGDNIGVQIEDRATGRRLFYAPGLAEVSEPVFEAMQRADVVLVDGTLWTDDEMIRLGALSRSGQAMGHLAQTGPGGMIEQLDRLRPEVRRILIHINNTNPILDEAGPERRELDTHGIEVAFDGMDIDV